jgi:hypothetical protein
MWSLNGVFTTTSNTCSSEVIPPGMNPSFLFMELLVMWLLFVVLNGHAIYTTAAYSVSQKHPWLSDPHCCQPVVHPFIGHPTFRLASDNDSSSQLLLGQHFVV